MQNNLNKYEYEYGLLMEWYGGGYPEDEEPGYHSIATRVWRDIWGIVVGIPAGARDSLHRIILTGFGSHHMSYSVGTSIYFPTSTVAEVKNVWPHTSASHIPLWHVQGNFTFTLNLIHTNQCTSTFPNTGSEEVHWLVWIKFNESKCTVKQ